MCILVYPVCIGLSRQPCEPTNRFEETIRSPDVVCHWASTSCLYSHSAVLPWQCVHFPGGSVPDAVRLRDHLDNDGNGYDIGRDTEPRPLRLDAASIADCSPKGQDFCAVLYKSRSDVPSYANNNGPSPRMTSHRSSSLVCRSC